ncbi:MAG: TIGR01212 family radical SAM protein [Muribaculaceae bacterium]|nr:TIGR01212 family radical SAM protein [Muribaculaceae bacterium]
MGQLVSFSKFIAGRLDGKIQKISVNAGHNCPNRDGTLSRGGCIYCSNQSFSPGYTTANPDIEAQIEAGRKFFGRKYPEMRYLVYFQSYTSTNASLEEVKSQVNRALAYSDVAGCVIGTRPDAVSEELLQWFASLMPDKFMMVEFGAETASDETLRLINRHHTWAQTVEAVEMAHRCGLPVGLHLIFGLPGEHRDEILSTIDAVNALPVDLLKCHHLQVIRNTPLHRMIEAGEIEVERWTPDDYAALCREVLGRLRPDIMVERLLSQAPPSMVVSPKWGLKNYQFINRYFPDATGPSACADAGTGGHDRGHRLHAQTK